MATLTQFKTKFITGINDHLGMLFVFICFLIMADSSFAGDALVSAEDVVKDTYNGSLKTYLYVGEAVAAVTSLIFTRNIKVLGGVGALAIFLNVVALLGGF